MIIGCLQSLIGNYPVLFVKLSIKLYQQRQSKIFFCDARHSRYSRYTRICCFVLFSLYSIYTSRILILSLNALKDSCVFRQFLSKCQKSRKSKPLKLIEHSWMILEEICAKRRTPLFTDNITPNAKQEHFHSMHIYQKETHTLKTD